MCSCLPEYIGSPPSCRPECTSNSECAADKACINKKCQDPCTGTCGSNAECRVRSHSPYCSCRPGYTGDAFVRCIPMPPPPPQTREPYRDPCVPSPCGQYAICRMTNEQPTCSCLPSYTGSPPNCRPECVINSDCASNRACINEKCRDPCPGSCGVYAVCNVLNHTPVCTCPVGYTGDPFINCHPQPAPPPPRNINLNPSILRTQTLNVPYLFLKLATPADDPCIPSPCGTNAQCSDGICTCIGVYQGDPYTGCRPECILNSECSRDKACINQKCQDPCPGTCASNAICEVHNHVPMCHCPTGMQGNAFVQCQPLPERPPEPAHPCQPSPCGTNSQCQDRNGIALCSCLSDMIGTPPACRPECISNSECLMNRACINQKCKDPCPGACGHNALCNIVNHNPICSCPTGYTGSPFVACQLIICTYFLLIDVF